MNDVNANDVSVILTDELEKLRERIIANHEAAGQVASGRTRDSLRVEVTEREGILWGRKGFGNLESGNPPWSRQPESGNPPKEFVEIISQWIKDKGLNLNAFLTAKKIMKEGTLLYKSGGRSDIFSSEIPQTIENIGNRLLYECLYRKFVESIKLNTK